VHLSPKTGADFRSVDLVVGAGDHLIREIDYLDRQGNRTRFEFSAFKRVKTDDASFRFDAPAGTEVIRNQE
jgi:outer membrane lipoprotein-sorting protein